jgi:hypothetical protein
MEDILNTLNDEERSDVLYWLKYYKFVNDMAKSQLFGIDPRSEKKEIHMTMRKYWRSRGYHKDKITISLLPQTESEKRVNEAIERLRRL